MNWYFPFDVQKKSFTICKIFMSWYFEVQTYFLLKVVFVPAGGFDVW